MKNLKDLENDFYEMVFCDSKIDRIQSFYMPNPPICTTPEFCLIGMEPSLKWMEKEERLLKNPSKFPEELRFERMNFLFSEEDFILHYCAFHYLCKGEYKYYVTDISKGAMLTKNAGAQRTARYQRWLSLLKQEIQILGNPINISIGKAPAEFLQKNNVEIEDSIMHYSSQNSGRFKLDYIAFQDKESLHNIHLELRAFSIKLLEHLQFPSELVNKKVDGIFQKGLTDWKKGIYLHYKNMFTEILVKKI